MEQPKVTFIIANHNYQEFLGSAVDSALSQTYPNIHVCVIDDCSNNQQEVLSIISEKASGNFIDQEFQDNQIVYRSDKITFIQLLKDSGSYHQAYARNRGIEACWNDSEFFAILDADDENYPTKIEECIQPMLDHPEEIGGVYGDTIIENAQTGNTVREYREPFDGYKLVRECIVHSGCVLSKKALEKVLENGLVFDEELPPCEDYDLWVRLAEHFLLVHIPHPLTFVRVHKMNSTNTTTHEWRIGRIKKLHEKRIMRLNNEKL